MSAAAGAHCGKGEAEDRALGRLPEGEHARAVWALRHRAGVIWLPKVWPQSAGLLPVVLPKAYGLTAAVMSLQYYNLGAKHPDLIEKRRRAFSDNLRRYARPAAALPPGAAGGSDSTMAFQPAAADVMAADAAAESAAADKERSSREAKPEDAADGERAKEKKDS